MEKEYIIIKGAKEHNLKNIDLEIPRNALVVITGLSGSGKSSLAFDTIYAEGQRRYVESLSSYARQFLEQLQKPDVEYIEGLSPAISIEQRTAGSNPRSTVGTQTEIYDHLRLMFARIGAPHCPKCNKPIKRQTAQEIVNNILKMPSEAKILVLAPVVRGRKGEYRELFQKARKDGFIRVRVDGRVMELEKPIPLDKNRTHDIEVVVDRLVLKVISKNASPIPSKPPSKPVTDWLLLMPKDYQRTTHDARRTTISYTTSNTRARIAGSVLKSSRPGSSRSIRLTELVRCASGWAIRWR